jgi:hypothetical protein
MKLLPPSAVVCAALTAAFSLAGCNANPDTNSHDHWNIKGLAPRVQRSVLGYDAERNGRYVDYQYANKKSIYLTMKRHGLNQNPENPFQPEDTAFYEPRPVHSIVPRPWEYINFEGIAFGGILTGMGAPFIPIPVDSIIGTASEGGSEEFEEGIRQTVTLGQSSSSGSFLHEAIGMEVKAAPID